MNETTVVRNIVFWALFVWGKEKKVGVFISSVYRLADFQLGYKQPT